MDLKQYVVDAFTQERFSGNPAAVILLSSKDQIDECTQQNIAAQNNLSETAFIYEQQGIYYIRWFSPFKEIDFCGHATLASAFVLIKFYQKSQLLTFYCEAIGTFNVYAEDGRYTLIFPHQKPQYVLDLPAFLEQGLSILPVEVLRNQQAYFALYNSAHQIETIEIDADQLKKLAPYDVVVTAPASDENYDFFSRYFWPANGGNEDPVTGSIHAGLFPFWSERLNKTSMVAKQGSNRCGTLYGEIDGAQVKISGYARLFSTSTIYI